MDEQEALVEDLSRLAIGEEHEMGDTVSEEGVVSMDVIEEIHDKIQSDGTVYQSLLTEYHTDQLLYPGSTEGCTSRFHWKKISKKFTDKFWQKQRRHPCHNCKLRFYSNFQLKVHIRSHTKISPYSCTICTKEFHYYHMAKGHLTNDHGIENSAQKDCVIQFRESHPEESGVVGGIRYKDLS